MELRQLQYFRETARLQHISKTAKSLCISQPSLSQAIKRLEEEVGLPLFDRSGRNITLNEAGRIFLKYVDSIFLALENAALELSSYQATVNKQVSLCVRSASALLPELLTLIKDKIPDIRLQIFQSPEDFQSDQTDLYLYSSPDSFCDPDSVLLLEEPIWVAIPESHSLAKQTSLSITQIMTEDFISLNQSSNLSHITNFHCQKYGFTPRVTTYVDSPATMRELLHTGIGISFIPLITWKDFIKDQLV